MTDDFGATSPTRTIARPAVKCVRSRAGPPRGTVVFVHGTMDHSGSFRRVADQLTDWTLVSYDRRGWGISRGLGQGPPTLAEHVHDLTAVLASRLCGSVADAPIVVGHSYGGLVSLCAAARQPDRIRGLLVFEPSIRWLPWWPIEAPWERLVRESSDQPQQAAKDLINAVAGMPIAHRRAPDQLAADGSSLITEMMDSTLNIPLFEPLTLDVPTIVAAGERSIAHHIEVSRRLAELLPRARYVEIAGCGHAAHISHSKEFSKLVEDVLDIPRASVQTNIHRRGRAPEIR
jgi:pimeloyl-ACP methyl ester carboxylesterase